jgi:hypothetical protein
VIPAAAALALLWLWFLALGKARGSIKRLTLRATLLAAFAVLVYLGAQRGLFVRASVPFRAAILVSMVAVAVGYLYSIRFCVSCGRMVRNLKVRSCPRCGELLPRHGMTARLHRAEPAEGAPQRHGPRPG